MSNLSDDDSSDSSNDFLVPAKKIDLESSFFKNETIKPKSKTNVFQESSDDSDEDLEDPVSNVSSAELLAQVLKNLENSQNKLLAGSSNLDQAQQSTSKQETKNEDVKDQMLSKEINDLLLQGEEESSLINEENDDDDDDESKADDAKSDYAIPKEGVNIHLPGENVMFGRSKKKKTDLQVLLKNRINQRIRSTQVFIHKTGLLCWLSHGFYLNQVANDPELLGICLSLMSNSNYPKGRPDLKYFEQFTKWFASLFNICEQFKPEVINKEILLERIKNKKIYNYLELVLLYIASVRGMGIHCRLVISLNPPRLKPANDQLFQLKNEDNDPVKLEAKETNKTIKTVSKKEESAKNKKAPKKKLKTEDNESQSPKKIVPENSPTADKNAKLEAKKNAAAIIKGKLNLKNLKGNEKNNSTVKPKVSTRSAAKNVTKKSEIEKSDSDVEDEANMTISRKLRLRTKKEVNDSTKNSKEAAPSTQINKKNSLSKVEVISEEESSDEESDPPKNVKNKIINKKNQKQKSKDLKDETEKDVEENKQEANTTIARKLRTRINKSDEKNLNTARFKNQKASKSTVSKTENKRNVSSDSEDEKQDEENSYSTDDEFTEKKPKKRELKTPSKTVKNTQSKAKIKNERKVLSSDEEESENSKNYHNCWVEVFVESEESWICVNILDKKIHCVSELFKKAAQPVLYVVAWNSCGTIKDVTRRYCPNWLTDTRKKRVEEKWWSSTLGNWKEGKTAMSKAEDEQLLQRELEQPLPKTITECKGHPLYALARHLLKYEAFYPPDVVPLGHLKTGEAIYSRHCVHTLYSRETWVKRARVVKPAQEAYKIVKAMPKFDKLSGMKLKDQPLELFGKWQTDPYVPPEAKDGKVPRNEYGNVDLFKMCMLPKGTVYINLPGLNRVCRKLDIDCAPAVVGFNFGCRGALPAFEGFVVCQEYEDTVREAWEIDQKEAQKRATEKRDKRIWGNWKKLIKGLFIRERIAAKYLNVDDNSDEEKSSKPTNKSKTNVEPKKRAKKQTGTGSAKKKIKS